MGFSRIVFNVVEASVEPVMVCKALVTLPCVPNEGMICATREGDVKTDGCWTSRLGNATALEIRDRMALTVSGSRILCNVSALLKVVIHGPACGTFEWSGTKISFTLEVLIATKEIDKKALSYPLSQLQIHTGADQIRLPQK
jgi:hypothetical protein